MESEMEEEHQQINEENKMEVEPAEDNMNEAGEEKSRSTGKKEEEQESESSEGSLDEEDRELIEENLRKRPAQSQTSASKKANVSLENLFDDEEEEAEAGEEKKLQSMDDMEDFIVSDEEGKESEEEEEKEARPKSKGPMKRAVKAPVARTFSSFKVSNDVYYDLMEVFGDPRDYQEMLDSFSFTKISSPKEKATEKAVSSEDDLTVEVTNDEVEFVMNELCLEEAVKEDVELVLKYIEEDKLEIIYLESYQQDLSLDGDTLWAIFDTHLQWKSLLKEKRKNENLLGALNGVFMFDTLSEFISKFSSSKRQVVKGKRVADWSEQVIKDFEKHLPEPVEFTIILSQGTFYAPDSEISPELAEYAGWRYALHPVTFQYFVQNCNQDLSLNVEESSMRQIVAKAQKHAATFINRRTATQEAKKSTKQRILGAVKDFNRLLRLRPVSGLEGEKEIGVVMIHGNQSACAVMEVRSGKLTKSFKAPDFDSQKGVQKIVIGGKGPQVRNVYEVLLKKFGCYLVKPLPGTEDLDCQSLGRFAIDPVLEIANRPKLSVLLNISSSWEEEQLETHLKRALLRHIAAKGVNLDECFESEWRKRALLLLPGMTAELAEAMEGIKSREQLRGIMSDGQFRNLSGFLLIPSSKEPLDATLTHPETRHPSMLVNDSEGISVMASGEQAMEMILQERIHKGKVFSGPVVKNDYPHALVIKVANGVEAVIKGPRNRVSPGQIASGELARVDADRFRLELYPLPDTDGNSNKKQEHLDEGVQQALARIAMHPLFKEMSGRQVEGHFQSIGLIGDVIVRPSRHAGHLSVSWKVSPTLAQHLDVEVTRAGKLRVAGDLCEDVDEIVGRLIDPLAQLVDSIVNCPKYFDFKDVNEKNDVEEHLKGNFVEGRIAYCVWLSGEEPGALMHIASLPASNRPVRHETVKLLLGGRLHYHGRDFDSLERLISFWKAEYSNPNPGNNNRKR